MSLEIEGKVKIILPEVTGQGRNGVWKKQEFVIDLADSQYPRSIIFNMWGDKASIIKSLNPGDLVKVSFDPESREYNGKWYTDLKAWQVVKLSAAPPADGVPAANNSSYSKPAANPSTRASSSLPPAPETPPLPDQEDDLPF